jgi:hypothetical protein
MSKSKYETFILRALAGLDPISMKSLPEDSVWLNAEVQAAFRGLIVVQENHSSKSDGDDGHDGDCVFPF